MTRKYCGVSAPQIQTDRPDTTPDQDMISILGDPNNGI